MKNQIDKSLRYLILTGTLLLISGGLYAQQPLVKPLGKYVPDKFFQEDKQSQAVLLNIRNRAKAGEANIFTFDKTVLKENKLQFTLPSGEVLEAIMVEKELRTEDDLTWYGHLNGHAGSVVVTLQDGHLVGNLEFKDKKYILSPLGKGTSLLFENKNIKYEKAFKENHFQNTTDNQEIALANDHGGAIRLLVAFTPLVEKDIQAMGYQNLKLFLQQVVSETNQSLINRRLAHRVSLALALPVPYTESGNLKQDLDRFANLTDGFMDDLPAYQKLYNADVTLLLTHPAGSGNLAPGIRAEEAACVVNYDYILGNSSFAQDVIQLHTNNLVSLNKRSGQAISSAAPDVLHLTNASSLKVDKAFGVITATSEIVLEPGFEVSENADLRLEVVPTVSNIQPGKNNKTETSENELLTDAKLPETILKLWSVPTNRILNIEVNLPRTALAVVDIYDTKGVRIKEVHKGELLHKRFTVDLVQQAEGIYIVSCRTQGQIISKKAALKK